ncbi:MAG: nucleoside-triphosphatase [Thermodesulfobacteriota bacterium]|nr:nucleoside-triphosphatase [Thermodesulfobacteriota bacterium]
MKIHDYSRLNGVSYNRHGRSMVTASATTKNEKYKNSGKDMSNSLKRVIITGEKQSGKSTLAAQLAAALKDKNVKIAGIIAKGIWKNNIREGFNLMDLKTGKSYPLAKRMEKPGKNSITGFEFLETGIAAGSRALNLEQCQDADVIFVDEIGRLEIKSLGWSLLLAPVLSIQSAAHIWIVRKKFVKEICSIWKVEHTEIINVDDKNALNRLKKI